jgi:hypothetical protein
LEFWLGSRLSRHCYSSSRRLAGWLADSIKNFVLNIGFFFLLRWFEIMSDWIVLWSPEFVCLNHKQGAKFGKGSKEKGRAIERPRRGNEGGGSSSGGDHDTLHESLRETGLGEAW